MLRDETIELDLDNAAADLLGQLDAIDTLVRVAGGLEPPSCVALYGAWGSGKTTLMHNAMRRCRDKKGWIPVWFDPWEYDRQPDVIQPLLRSLLLAVKTLGKQHDPDRWAAVVKQAGRIAKSFAALAARVAVRSAINLTVGPATDGLVHVEPHESARFDTEAWLDGDESPPDEVAEVKAQFKALVDAALRAQADGGVPPSDARVVFFLDDLDRCLPDRVVELIEGVKLLLCGAPECKAVFVFALDRQIVGEAIRHRFPGSTQYSGENYLEKIFDFSLETPLVPLGLTEAKSGTETILERFVEQLASSLPDSDLDTICEPLGGRDRLLWALRQPAFGNPRVIKRSINRLYLLTASTSRRVALASVAQPEQQGRLMLWLVAAERFRAFRHFARRASFSELTNFVREAAAGGTAAPDPARLLSTPGFSAFCSTLKLHTSASEQERVAWSKYESERHRHTVRWFDDLMRSAGV